MVEKELEDYIRTQKSLGVSDHAIHKSLLDAGYELEEFKDTLDKHSKAHSRARAHSSGGESAKKPFSLAPHHLLYLNFFLVVVFVGMFMYMSYDYNAKLVQLKESQQFEIGQVSTKITQQGSELSSQMESMEESLYVEISGVETKVETVKTDLDKKISDYNYQAVTRDTQLSDSIQKSTSTSLTELSGFAQQLEEFREATVDFSPIIPKAVDAVVTVGSKGSGFFTTAGSGVIINNNGYIVTNWHVVDDLNNLDVKLSDGNDYQAELLGKDEDWDVALIRLKTERDDFEYLSWRDSDSVTVGEHVIAVGNPVGFDSTVTEGIISNTRRLIPGDGADKYYFQTDVAINAGNSGGPLIDEDGKIVGIATLKYAKTGFEGLSFALRADDVERLTLDMLQET